LCDQPVERIKSKQLKPETSACAKISILLFEITSHLEDRSLMLTPDRIGKTSEAGNLARVFRVTGGNTDHYSTSDLKQQRFVRILPQESEKLLADPIAQKIVMSMLPSLFYRSMLHRVQLFAMAGGAVCDLF
jgi:hypothetical protein